VTYYCRVCGEPVDPKVDVAFGHRGKVMFAAHEGRCAEVVRQSVSGLGQVANVLLQRKAPKLHAVLGAVRQALGGEGLKL
jgi:hypothetical protein